jgi:hypothetical protein
MLEGMLHRSGAKLSVLFLCGSDRRAVLCATGNYSVL